jgi:hypothetical protein
MIISIDDRRGSRWPIPFALAVLCGLAVFGAGFMQQRALDAGIATQETKAGVLARQAVAPTAKDLDLTKPLPHEAALRLEHDLEKGALAGDVVLRVRIFARDGRLLFSTDPEDRVNDPRVGDADMVRAASIGATTSSVGTDQVSAREGRPVSVELLQTYVELPGGKGSPAGVVGVDQRYEPIVVASQQPWHTVQLGVEAAAALFVVTGLLLLARRVSAKRAKAKARVGAAPKEPAKDAPAPSEPTETPERRRSFRKERSAAGPPAPTDADRARKDAQREIQVREALEGQLEQLRTRIREQEDLASRQVLELTQQLQVAAARVEDAETRAASTPSGVDAERLADAERRVQEAAQRADQAQSRAVAAESRVAELEERLADANRASAPPPTDERIAELERVLAEARADASDSARRAEATEAVREELEVKVAQFGSRAQEQEATAAALAEQLREIEAVRADLERRASDAESGGDAVRSEMAQLMAERDSFKARVAELEHASATTEPPTRTEADIEELELLASARSELSDLRQQLGHAIEQARAAEERSAKLEADLLAERQGIGELSAIRELSEMHDVGSTSLEEPDDEQANPFPWMDTNSNGNGTWPTDGQPAEDEPEPADEGADAEDTEPSAPDKSLRYRLAQSAARKKGLGDLEPPS